MPDEAAIATYSDSRRRPYTPSPSRRRVRGISRLAHVEHWIWFALTSSCGEHSPSLEDSSRSPARKVCPAPRTGPLRKLRRPSLLKHTPSVDVVGGTTSDNLLSSGRPRASTTTTASRRRDQANLGPLSDSADGHASLWMLRASSLALDSAMLEATDAHACEPTFACDPLATDVAALYSGETCLEPSRSTR